MKKGIVGRRGRIVGTGSYFGEDIILSNFIRNYSVMSLSYLDVYRLDREDLLNELRNDKFPRIAVCLCFHVYYFAADP